MGRESISKQDEIVQEIEKVSDDSGSYIEGRILVDHERIVAERKLVRKLDSRLMPCVFIIYIMNYVRFLQHAGALIQLTSLSR